MRSCERPFKPGQQGFTLVGTLLIVAILALVAAGSVRLGALVHRRHAEQQLLDEGMAFSVALGLYARATPPGQPDAPLTLQELLKDPRLPSRLRHLRKIFMDPLTGSEQWGLERDENGRIMAVYSLAGGEPIKRAGFEPRFSDFGGKKSYQDWKFKRSPEESGRAAGAQIPSGSFNSPVDIDTIEPGEPNVSLPTPAAPAVPPAPAKHP